MKVILLEPQDDLISVIASRLMKAETGYSSNIVIFPEYRPGFYLRRFLAAQEKKSFVPPQIYTLDELVNQLYRQIKGRADHFLSDLDAVALLFDLHRQSRSPLGGESFQTLDRFLPWGIKIFAELETLKKATVPPEKIAEIDLLIDEKLSTESHLHFQSLSTIYRQFYEQLEKRKASTLASRYEKVIQHFPFEEFGEGERVIIAGFFSLQELERQVINLLGEKENCDLILIKGKGLGELGLQLGFPAEEAVAWEETKPSSPSLQFYLSPDTHGQIFALNGLLKDKLKRCERKMLPQKLVVVLPAVETLFPLYQFILSPLEENDFNISLGYPLSRTPLFSFFDKLFDLLQNADEEGRLYLPDYLRFVLHPYVKNIFFPEPRRADLTRIMFHTLEEEFLHQKNRSFWRLEEIENDPAIQKRLLARFSTLAEVKEPAICLEHLKNIHNQTIRLFLRIESIEEFGRKIISLIEFIYHSTTARQHFFFHRYAEAMVTRLEELGRSQLSQFQFEQNFGYFNLFRNLMTEARVPFPGTPLQGLQILGFWETRGLKFEEVFFLDLNEDVLPGTSKIDFLIPLALRKQLGLPTYEDIEKKVEYYFNLLINGARQAHLFFVENSEKEKSRLVEKLIWKKQKKEKIPDASTLLRSVRYQISLKPRKGRCIPKTQEIVDFFRNFRFSASSLDLYLNCPLKFYYAYALNLREKEEISEAMEPRDVGLLVHRILENYYQPYLNQPLTLAGLDLNRLERITSSVFREIFGPTLSGNALLMYHQVLRHLKDFILRYQEPIIRNHRPENPVTIIGLEKEIEGDWLVPDHRFAFVARVDRLEMRGKKLYLLDYKTAASEANYSINFKKLNLEDRSSWPEAIHSLQIPLYVFIASQAFRRPPHEIEGKLLFLGKNRIDPSIEYSTLAEDGEGREFQLKTIAEVINRLLVEIINPQIPFAEEMRLPGAEEKKDSSRTKIVRLAARKACEYCSFLDLCGR